ncbi:hypothetical protein Pelo_11970 [Pelomyxa schiedti]|nr:hypothetical protein Pelo_11970 [Pelomyxa schiedti]
MMMGNQQGSIDENTMNSLCGMFNQMDQSVVYQVLHQNRGDMEAAVEALLNMGPKSPSPALSNAPTPQNNNQGPTQTPTHPDAALYFPGIFSPTLQTPTSIPINAPGVNTGAPGGSAPGDNTPSAPHSDAPAENNDNGSSANQPVTENVADSDQAQLVNALRAEVVSLKSRNEELMTVLDAQSQKITSLENLRQSLEQQAVSLQQSIRQQTEQYNRDIAMASNISKQAFLHSLSSLAHTLQLSVSSLSKDCNDPRITASDMFQKVSSQMNLKPSSLVTSSTAPTTPFPSTLYQTGTNKAQTIPVNPFAPSPSNPTTVGGLALASPLASPPPYAVLYNNPQQPMMTQQPPNTTPQTPTQQGGN